MTLQPHQIPLHPKAPPRFGTRVSRVNPEFEIGDHTFETRLISMSEDRALTRQQASLPKADKDEAGEDLPLTPEQTEQTVTIMSGIIADLLRTRVQDKDRAHEITTDWVLDHMTTNGFGPLMFFLRNGYEDPATLALDQIEDEHGADLGDDPNADQ